MRPVSHAVSVDSEKYQFFLNDLVAASWAMRSDLHADQVNGFLRLHESFMRRLGRPNKGFFSQIPSSLLLEIIRGWVQLYQLTLKDLVNRFPRSRYSPDLNADGVNWSEKLKINAEGLLCIGSASRYAEFWAERSVRTVDKIKSLADRKKFVETRAYREYAGLVNKGEFLALDRMANGVPSYEMFEAIVRFDLNSETNFRNAAVANSWSIVQYSDTSIGTLFSLAGEISSEFFNYDQQDSR